MTDKENVDIAVVGGGIAGLCLALGLFNNGFNATIYEAAQNFGEIGAGVMFGPNAVRAMRLIDPRLEAALRRICDRDNPELRFSNVLEFRHGHHSAIPSKGPRDYPFLAAAVDHSNNLTPASRATFLDELVKLMPPGRTQFNKRLASVSEKEDGMYELVFKDGTTARHQVILGTDGIRSQVRKYVLGPDSPNLDPKWAKNAGWRGRVPMDKAIEIIGEDLARRNTAFLGEGIHLVCYCVGGGKYVNLTPMAYRENWDHDEWVVPSSQEQVREGFKGWPQEMLDLLEQLDCSTIRGLYDLPEAETYYRGRAVIIGDAAHATTPFQGSGAGVAIEDACVLGHLFGSVNKIEDVEPALAAYDSTRRPRGLKLVQTSRQMGDVMNYRDPKLGSDFEALGADLSERFNWIWNIDLEAEIEAGKKRIAESV